MNDEELENKAYAYAATFGLRRGTSEAAYVVMDYIAGYRAAEPKWISPKDHPPADGTWAIIYMPDGGKGLGKTAIDVSKNGGWEDWAYEVTLYFPVTKLPKEEEGDFKDN